MMHCDGTRFSARPFSWCGQTFLLALFALAGAPALPGFAETPGNFDHNFSGFPLTGVHANSSCETCHTRGRFEGTPTRCEDCHDGTGLLATTARSPRHVPVTGDCGDCHTTNHWMSARMDHSVVTTLCDGCHFAGMTTPKPLNHVTTSSQCDQCHRTSTWSGARFDHSEIVESCSSCHNGFAAAGKGTSHIVTTGECDMCHSTRRWSPATFDHALVTGTCSTCHNGVEATGKDPLHIQTTAECDLCHSTVAFTPATAFDHNLVSGSCSTCHDGVTATGKDPLHIQTTAECDLCHSTIAFTPATFDHDLVVGSCSNCHNGVEATGLSGGHFQTSLECDTCHVTTRWEPAEYAHGGGGYPGDHRDNLDCGDCHGGNSDVVTWESPGFQPDCAACHERDFKRDSHKKVDGAGIKYTVSELRDCTGACHEYEDRNLTRIKKTRNGEHRVRDSEF